MNRRLNLEAFFAFASKIGTGNSQLSNEISRLTLDLPDNYKEKPNFRLGFPVFPVSSI
jgi:hypothetical protein